MDLLSLLLRLASLLAVLLPGAARAATRWEAVDQRATIAAASGVAPALTVGLLGLPPAFFYGRGAYRSPPWTADATLMFAPEALVGQTLLVGGGLRSRRALVEQGADVPSWPGWSALGLEGVSLAALTVGAGAPSPRDRAWLVGGELAWLGAVGLGSAQLALDGAGRASLHPNGVPLEIGLDRGARLYHTGQLMLLGGAGSLIPGLRVYDHSVRKPVTEQLAAGEIYTASAFALIGTPLMIAGGLRETRALAESGRHIPQSAAAASVTTLLLVPAEIAGSAGAFRADRTGVGAGLALGALATGIAAPIFATAQHRAAVRAGRETSSAIPLVLPLRLSGSF